MGHIGYLDFGSFVERLGLVFQRMVGAISEKALETVLSFKPTNTLGDRLVDDELIMNREARKPNSGKQSCTGILKVGKVI